MRSSFSIAEDLVFVLLLAAVIAIIGFAVVATNDAHPLVSSTDIVVTEPSKVDGEITPSRSRPPLYVSETTPFGAQPAAD